ncbi:ATP synthase F1 subunit delta [Lunatimonas salinarum]|uniref:ATP synthase F1 subunit delta n=1 Tax=Lunatimonas salinarum TaxID=1774590 RepID=UPI001AE0AE16|nr:ATP synthase F1 subunit delta [Lunatimonas salinarum]
MSEFRVASRYAKSLLELAVEKGILEQVHQDMTRLLELEAAHPELAGMLKSPIVSSDKKLTVLESILKSSASELTLTFVKLVSQKGRESFLPAMAREFHRQYNIQMGIQLAEVTTTFNIDKELRTRFVEIVKEVSGKKQVELIEKVNPKLIGGFVLKVDDRQLDESIHSKLRKLRLDFTENLYEKKF